MTCCPVCMCGLGGVGLQYRPCDMLSSMSVGLGWGGVTTHHVMCCPVICGVGVGLQHRPSVVIMNLISITVMKQILF